jgi:nicotinamidase-related amidase
MKLGIPVRFTSTTETLVEHKTISVETNNTAFLLIDCDGDCGPLCNEVIEKHIAPTLHAVRTVGIKPIFLYGEPLPDGPHSLPGELHWTRWDEKQPPVSWKPSQPIWSPSISPLQDEPTFAKSAQSGFVNTYLDRYLRAWGIDTILVVGFSFKSCLFYTLVSAYEHNYRVIFLRDGTDPLGTNEFSDTVEPSLPEKGWVRRVLTRLIEDHLGYSSTCAEIMAACHAVRNGE